MEIVTIEEIRQYMTFRGQKWPNARDALAFAYQEIGEAIEAFGTDFAIEMGDFVQMLSIAAVESGHEALKVVEGDISLSTDGLPYVLNQIIAHLGHINDGLMRMESGWVRNSEREVSIQRHLNLIEKELYRITPFMNYLLAQKVSADSTVTIFNAPENSNPYRQALILKWASKGFHL